MGPLRLTGDVFLTETDKERLVSLMGLGLQAGERQVPGPGLASARGLGSVSFY